MGTVAKTKEKEARMTSSREFWQGKRVFITGHTGFKGAWLTAWLQSLGAKVCGFSLPPETQPNLFSFLNLGASCEESHFEDIRHFDTLKNTLQAFAPDIVLHLAAQALVRESYYTPLATIATNVQGTANVLEACRNVPSVRAALIITTDKCYKNKETLTPYRENDELGGRDIYSASKASTEIITHAYRQSFFENGNCAVATARAGNVIGGGDWSKDRLLVDAARAFASGDTLTIRSPKAVRPWQHVVEPLWGYIMLAQAMFENKKPLSAAYNFGPDASSTASVEQVIDLFARYWQPQGKWQVDAPKEHLHEAGLLTLDSALAKNELGWKTRFTLEEALAHTARGYQLCGGEREAFVQHMQALFTAYAS